MSLFLSPIGNDQFVDANGDPLTGGKIETYLAGSSTSAATYTSSAGTTPQANPVILNTLGAPSSPIWLTGGISYKFIIKDADDVTLRTIDDISGINDASVSQSEWVESGLSPTYIGATSFSVPGDQTPILQIGRRLRTTNTSGLVYSTISNSAFAAGITTVTLTNDSTTLDAGLSLVAYSLLSVTNSAIPNASETVAGKAEKLTTAEAVAGLDDTRFHSAATMKAAQIQLRAAQTATGLSSVSFTDIPAWVRRITIHTKGVSSSTGLFMLVRIGDSGGYEITGYDAAAMRMLAAGVGSTTNTTGFLLSAFLASSQTHAGTFVLERVGTTGDEWVGTGMMTSQSGPIGSVSTGTKTLSATLDRVQIVTTGGDTFVAGQFAISYE